MKFKRSTSGCSTAKTTAITATKSNLKTIDNRVTKKVTKPQIKTKKSIKLKFFDLEGKENNHKNRRRVSLSPGTRSKSAESPQKKKSPLKNVDDDVLSQRMAHGLSLWSSKLVAPFNEAKPIPKPTLSFLDGSQNYFKRSFSMRAKSSNSQSVAVVGDVELKTATIRRAFGKSLTSKTEREEKEAKK